MKEVARGFDRLSWMRQIVSSWPAMLIIGSLGLEPSLSNAQDIHPLPAASPTEPDGKPSLQAVRIETTLQIDGKLTEAAWMQAPAGGPLWQYDPATGKEMSELTLFRILYDTDHLYIGIWCYDSDPKAINARVMQRDNRSIYSDDYLYMALDTFHDQRNGYVFVVNPNGARYDQIVSNNIFLNSNWDGVWRAACSIDQEGWKAELAIPFKSLSFNPDNTTWGFNLSRSIARKVERGRWTGAKPNLHTFHVSQAGDITNLRGLKQGLGIELSPYALARWNNRSEASGTSGDLGLDARYRITPNLSTTLSYNTDFAEAEVDQRQLNFTRFPLFFPERRAFFLEDSGVFEYGGLTTSSSSRGLSRPVLPFFSRRIGRDQDGRSVPILLAAKLAGRQGKLNMGFMNATLEDHHSLGMKNVFAGRMARDVLEQSSVGMITTVGDPNTRGDNYLFGPDFRFRTANFNRGQVLEANVFALGSHSENLTSQQGHAYGASIAYPNDFFRAHAQYVEVSDQFDPALGFVARKNVRGYYTYTSLNPRPERPAWLRQYRVAYSTEHFTTLDNQLQTALHRLTPLWLEFNSGDEVYLSLNRQFDGPREPFEILGSLNVPEGEYWWDAVRVGVEFASRRKVSGDINTSVGNFYSGTRFQSGTGLNYYPWKRMSLGLDYDFNQIEAFNQSATAHLGAGRILFNFTPNLTWAHLIQYDSLSESVGYNSRLIWEYQPGSKIYAVVNQNYLAEDLSLKLGDTEATLKIGAIFRF